MEGEDRLLGWLRRRIGSGGRELLGDDSALLPAGGPWALTLDHQIAGIHFPPGLDPATVARRALAVNLSDLAATGAVPAYAFLALAAPLDFDHRRFLTSLLRACRRHRIELAGGDLARSDRLSAVVALVGRQPPGGRFLTRRAGRPGDALWLGGTLGESAAGRLLLGAGARLEAGARVSLPRAFAAPAARARACRRAVRRHLLPTPQLELGRWLGKQPRAAAIDLSDGFGLDLHRLCRESGAGAEVEALALPLAPGLEEIARALGERGLDLALAGGEDYVLLFALPPSAAPPSRLACHRIGELTGRRSVRMRQDGRLRPLAPAGWDHLR